MKIVKIMCPTAEELGRDVERNIKCPETDCDRVFQHQPALRMHLIKVHKILQGEKDVNIHSGKKNDNYNFDVHFHCPLQACKYSSAIGSYFKKLSGLRQHFLKVHGEKKYFCVKCGNKFSLERIRRQHELKCYVKFRCSNCQQEFVQKTRLLEHCISTNHPYLFDDKDEISRISHEMTGAPTKCTATQNTEKQKIENNMIQNSICGELINSQESEKVHNEYIGKCRIESKSCNKGDDCSIMELDKYFEGSYNDLTRSKHSFKETSFDAGSSVSYDYSEFNNGNHGGLIDLCSGSNVNETVLMLPNKSGCSNSKEVNLCHYDIRTVKSVQNKSEDVYKKTSKVNYGGKLIKNDHNLAMSKLPIKTSTSSVTVLTKEECEKYIKDHVKDQLSSKVCPRLLPKLPPPIFMTVMPYFTNPVSGISQNVSLMPKPRSILPKQEKICMASTSSVDISQINSKNGNVKIMTIGKANETVNFKSKLAEKKNTSINKRATSSTQTGGLKKKLRKVAETQTAGDYILKQAMMTAKLPVIKESRGSQVSPRAKLKRTWQQVQNSQTQTFGNLKQNFRHKKQKMSSHQCDFSTNTNFSPPASIETQTSLLIDEVLAKQEKAHVSVYSQSEDIVTAVNNGQVRLLESSSTQTYDSYLSNGQIVDHQFGSHTQDSEIQTKLSMNMSLDECDSKDLQRLEQVGFATPNLACSIDSLYSTSGTKMNSFNPVMAHIPAHKSPIIAQADTVISNKIAELLHDSQPSGHSFSSGQDPLFALDDSSSNGLNNMISGNITAVDNKMSCLSSGINSCVTGVQTSTDDFDLPIFLSTEVQTINFDNNFSNSIETQTTNEDIIDEFLNNMQTQTNDELWAELGFSNIQTQTSDLCLNSPGQIAVNVETQTNQGHSFCTSSNSQSVETQASLLNVSSNIGLVDSADIQTQTLFDNLTDSHTQTSWKDLMKFVNAVDDH